MPLFATKSILILKVMIKPIIIHLAGLATALYAQISRKCKQMNPENRQNKGSLPLWIVQKQKKQSSKDATGIWY